jgi:hypothetical protein
MEEERKENPLLDDVRIIYDTVLSSGSLADFIAGSSQSTCITVNYRPFSSDCVQTQ